MLLLSLIMPTEMRFLMCHIYIINEMNITVLSF